MVARMVVKERIARERTGRGEESDEACSEAEKKGR